jgi:hypothetical protein
MLGIQEQVNLLEEERLATKLYQNVRLVRVVEWMMKKWLLDFFIFLISTFWRIWSPCSAMLSVRISSTQWHQALDACYGGTSMFVCL